MLFVFFTKMSGLLCRAKSFDLEFDKIWLLEPHMNAGYE